MTEPSLALQGAIVAALKASAALGALIGDRVFDRVPAGAVKPYIRIGDDQVIPDPAECFERSAEVFATLDVFSSAVGKPEAKRIAGAIVDALDHAHLDLGPDWTL